MMRWIGYMFILASAGLLSCIEGFLNGDSVDNLFKDPQCDSIDGRSFLSPFCQDYVLKANQTVAFSVNLDSFPPSYSVNASMDQQIIIDLCGFCADQLNQWINAYNAKQNPNCQIDALILQTICSIDPKSNLQCVNHIMNVAIPSTADMIISAVLFPGKTSFPREKCDKVSCCEVSALNSGLSLAKSSGLLSGAIESSLEALSRSMQSTCSSSLTTSCSTLLVQKDTPTPPVIKTSEKKDSLSPGTGRKAGIAAGVLIGCTLVAGGAVFLFKRRPRQTGMTTATPSKGFKFTTVQDEPEADELGEVSRTGPQTAETPFPR